MPKAGCQPVGRADSDNSAHPRAARKLAEYKMKIQQ
jgi:hypothetical protein